VIASMTFRTPSEAVASAEQYAVWLWRGSVWSQNIDVAVDIAKQIKAGVIWINCTESIRCRRRVWWLPRKWLWARRGARRDVRIPQTGVRPVVHPTPSFVVPAASASLSHVIDRTTKFYIAGKQARPDSGYSRVIRDDDGHTIGEDR
jgi:aldehyde dehydrogenase (NAD+)